MTAVLVIVLAGLGAAVLVRPATAGEHRLVRLARPAQPALRARVALRRPDRVGRSRRQAQERARAVEACAALGAELRAGQAPGAALTVAAALAVGPTGQVLRAAAASADVGGDVPAVLVAGAEGCASPSLLRGLAACWSLCASTGSGLAAAVERLEAAERDARDRRRAVQAELAGPRATAALLAVLPLIGLLLAGGLGAQPHRVFATPVGAACLVLGIGLDLAGLAWTRRLVRRADGSGAPS
jgi:tight adherence protein B